MFNISLTFLKLFFHDKSALHAVPELSIPKINRLLRPLKNKCAILAFKSAEPTTITYRSTSSKLSESYPWLICAPRWSAGICKRRWLRKVEKRTTLRRWTSRVRYASPFRLSVEGATAHHFLTVLCGSWTRSYRWTIIAHATSMVVDSCPNHPSLMLNLLSVALFHGLLTE